MPTPEELAAKLVKRNRTINKVDLKSQRTAAKAKRKAKAKPKRKVKLAVRGKTGPKAKGAMKGASDYLTNLLFNEK